VISRRVASHLCLRIVTAFMIGFIPVAPYADEPLQISDVVVLRSGTMPEADPAVVQLTLSHPARVDLCVYDGREVLIRRVSSHAELARGVHRLEWDGTDLHGRPVPDEAYHFTLEGHSAGAAPVVWDLSDATGGESLSVLPPRWLRDEGRVEFTLARDARVRVRVGLTGGGPLVRTLLDWVPRPAGVHSIAWDGRDAAGVLDVAEHPSLAVIAEAFALPRNTLWVGKPPDRTSVVSDVDDPVRRRRAARKPLQRHSYASQAMETRRDYRVEIQVKTDERASDGTLVIRGPVVVRVDVAESLRAQVLNERMELVHYVDGRLQYENEVGFLPASWRLDPAGLAEGDHYLTTNLRGYEGHFGVDTVRIRVAPPLPLGAKRESAGEESP
jgi:hypothetical protein